MDEKKDSLKELVNSSGYPFQLAVMNEVRASQKQTMWKILTHEHPWRNPIDDNEGFIDLVLGLGNIRLVIECKRPRGGVWLFLMPDSQKTPVDRFRICWTHIKPGRKDLVNWADYHVKPESPESEFCVMRGGEDKEPVLERWARNVLGSMEALAREEMGLERPSITDRLGVLIPAIVTAAELKVCKFNLKEIDLSDGTIDRPKFETVPWIRFRKSLSTSITEGPGLTELSHISERKVRSLFVINSLSLSSFLEGFSHGTPVRTGLDSWIVARQIEEAQGEHE